MAYQHGITVTEVTAGARTLVDVATAVIGLVATATAPAGAATAALDAAFPLNRPALVTDIAAAIGVAGTTGTLRLALQAIADQARAPVVVVRVAAGADAAATNTAVIGGTVNGLKTGMQALLAAEAQLGIKPRILGCPGLDTQAVTTALVVVAQKLRGMAYASAIGADIAAATAYRGSFSARELMLICPDFIAFDTVASANATSFAVARALGMRARIDSDEGWHKTLSNVPVVGVVGLTKDIQFDVQDPNCEANLLNAQQVTALIRSGGGFRFWGSRTTIDPTSPFTFESATRTAQVLMDTIAGGMTWAIDKPLRPSLVKDIVETINGTLRGMKTSGQIIDGNAWFDAAKNTAATLKTGKVTIDYDYTPVPPLENLMLNQRITDSYLADFSVA
ncbi:phage tail sheath subtilisin-like domain-containing protein [Sphingomonas albertensis]|uniref:Phage tail sheath subtilisin-like domain-containing protein n=1 Tax=Sphingomonas albertensis TaxID=2762591 RepID=A0ABR7AKG2_9SPHN|nr:phage tail sheath subtilisin-like domain-containing protein [Sphingomonas albertensis]MBC3940938.1 phage tail sheath subtilisin-like domain-containing protein [Sphingomonas albertensis]